MANKRIYKKQLKKQINIGVLGNKRNVNRSVGINTAIRSLTTMDVVEKNLQKIANKGHTAGDLTEYYYTERERARSILQQAQMSNKEIREHIYARNLKLDQLEQRSKQLDDLMMKNAKAGKKPTHEQLKQLAEYGTEALYVKNEIQKLENIRNISKELGVYEEPDYLVEYDEDFDETDAALRYGLIKTYEELKDKGLAPHLDGLEKYEEAQWALNNMPTWDLRKAIMLATEKRNQLRIKAEQISRQAEIDSFEMQQLAKQYRLM